MYWNISKLYLQGWGKKKRKLLIYKTTELPFHMNHHNDMFSISMYISLYNVSIIKWYVGVLVMCMWIVDRLKKNDRRAKNWMTAFKFDHTLSLSDLGVFFEKKALLLGLGTRTPLLYISLIWHIVNLISPFLYEIFVIQN